LYMQGRVMVMSERKLALLSESCDVIGITWYSFTERLIVVASMYSAFADKPERNCHFPVPGRNCMTHLQALQDFSRYESSIAM
jgi:hypothetical protein